MELSVLQLGSIETAIGPYLEYVLLAFVLMNLAARAIAHRSTVRQAKEGDAEAIKRHPALVATHVLLIVSVFYYTTLHFHSGVVLSVLVLGMVLTDFFEFEARKVEARQSLPIERPKGAIVASLFVLSYAAYLSVFFIIKPLWTKVV
ncbi:DUF7313 family protein [Halocatena marina]|uniref:DUF7313 domain-containing protein n=1 Tax=Halocatena marina TaxID=2934937 RepID=A0ABD5YUS7_9EURY|nr:hypothetical protein [Halocatena marina]